MNQLPTFDEFLNESKSPIKILYRFSFNDSYKKDGKSADPVFCKLTEVERNKAAKYAAVNLISGYGERELNQLSTTIRGEGKEVSYTELMDLIKSMKK